MSLYDKDIPACPVSAMCFWRETLTSSDQERRVRADEAKRWRRRLEQAEARADAAEENARAARAELATVARHSNRRTA